MFQKNDPYSVILHKILKVPTPFVSKLYNEPNISWPVVCVYVYLVQYNYISHCSINISPIVITHTQLTHGVPKLYPVFHWSSQVLGIFCDTLGTVSIIQWPPASSQQTMHPSHTLTMWGRGTCTQGKMFFQNIYIFVWLLHNLYLLLGVLLQ